ncbi:MAG: hypothetical protein HQL95_03730 [Magnetococcales bacterium]|nr:hypothetical protein [Magnetococcales bacterium]
MMTFQRKKSTATPFQSGLPGQNFPWGCEWMVHARSQALSGAYTVAERGWKIFRFSYFL